MEPIENGYRELIANYLNGSVNDSFVMIKLMIQCVGILVAGLVLWRVSAIFNRKKTQQRRRTVFMESRFQDQWKKRK